MSSRLLDDRIIRSTDARTAHRRGTFIRPEGYTSPTAANSRLRRAMTAVLVSCGVLLAFEIVLIVMILL